MRRLLLSVVSFVMLGILSCASGCATVGFVASPSHTFSGADSMLVSTPRADILDVVAEVGKSMGYDVTSFDKNSQTVSFGFTEHPGMTLLIGKMNWSSLSVVVQDGGRKLALSYTITGNFETGDHEAAGKLVTDFKAKMAERLAKT